VLPIGPSPGVVQCRLDLESKAHVDRFEAERLFAVFNELNLPMETLMAEFGAEMQQDV
jgi:hypothetical protein